jgi:hypothetical protein
LLVIIHADDFEALLARGRQMAEVFASHGKEFPAFVAIHSGFGRVHIAGSTGLDLDEAEHVPVPPDEVDFAATIGRVEITGDHHVSALSQIEVGGFFSFAAGAQVIGCLVWRQSLRGDPVEDANGGVSEASGKH